MTQTPDKVPAKLPSPEPLSVGMIGLGIAIFVAVMLVLGLPLLYWGSTLHAERGLELAGIALGVCLGAGVLAIAAYGLLQRAGQGPSGLLLGMGVRLAPPLAGGMLNEQLFGAELGALFFKLLLGFYLIGLVTETAVVVWLVSKCTPPPPKK